MADPGRPRARPVVVGPPQRRITRAERIRAARNRRRRRMITGLSISVLILVVVGAVFLGSKMWHAMFAKPTDYEGNGVTDVVIEVHDGDSTTVIGQTLLAHKVVATVQAFVNAAAGNSGIAHIQPGFYQLRTEIPASNAVSRLTNPQSRVGKLVIPEGRQLDDVQDVKTNVVTDGIFTLISRATCVDLDGRKQCLAVSDLSDAAAKADPPALAVPDWAVSAVQAMPDNHRRLEGLIAPGTWNVDPSASPTEILSQLIAAGARHYTQVGLLDAANAQQMSPYQVLTVASLVQREAKPQDFAKVARVINNRLTEHRKLEFDSTVNYPLDRQEVATTDADRSHATPWNTYVTEGLPATAICSPGDPALDAALHPASGDWLYFVTVDMQGTTLFTRDYAQHLLNIEQAKRNGVLDSAR
jgi:UPF0755 protein